MRLATDLVDSGVDVLLDKWELREGRDTVHFMERMVTDPEVKKVIIVSDRVYAERANSRTGGVGTETQIISKKVYDNESPDKFVIVVTERDDEGKAAVPAYYNSKIYIDYTNPDTSADNFDKLLRWVYDKPIHIKPPLGRRPAFLDESESVSLGTTSAFNRALAAVKEGRPNALNLASDYFELFVTSLEKVRVTTDSDEDVLASIKAFEPFRNEALGMVSALIQYQQPEEAVARIHTFFENMVPYMHRSSKPSEWRDNSFDNYRYVIHEMFVYSVAAFIRHDKLEALGEFLSRNFYVGGIEGINEPISDYTIFTSHLPSLERINNSANPRKLSIRGHFLSEGAKTANFQFRQFLQADFLLYLRWELNPSRTYAGWWPGSLLYIRHYDGVLEVFARATSRKYLLRLLPVLGISHLDSLEELFEQYAQGKRQLPQWQFERLSPAQLTGFSKLGTMA
ncbi:SEFIR domain-containing protein [Rhizobium sp. NFR03]|nr:SEFIR domain-containing protein [Rhizobium sp. NFR03]